MWFEVNVRLSEVTDLKWPHGSEWQCGNSTLAMSWPNHVQILSFASMASRQGAVKHGYVSKIAGGCSSYDVIAPWPDLTWSIFFYQKLRKVCPIRYPKTRRRYAPPFFRYLRKTSGGGCTNPPVRARVKGSMPPCIDHMELLAWMQRADFSEHIQRFKLHGNPLNSPHFDAPNTKFAPTGYRRAPNIISHHYKQQVSAKASIIPKARPIRFR